MSGPDGSLGASTEREIRSMPALWTRTVDRLHEDTLELAAGLDRASPIVFLGCGSGHIAGATGVELLREAGVAAVAPVASDYVLRPAAAPPLPGLAIAISRSGETSETCAALEAFKARTGGRAVAVTCRPGSRLASLADTTIAISEFDEQAIPQTRSVSAFLVVSTLLAGHLSEQDHRGAIVEAATRIDERAGALWRELARASRAERYVLLGAGVGYHLAEEAALKLVEMGRVSAWPWRALEYRHGPLEALDERTAVVGPLGADLAPVEEVAVREAQAKAGWSVDVTDALEPLSSAARPLAQLYGLHALALLAARAAGRDADAPQRIRSYVDDVDLAMEEVIGMPAATPSPGLRGPASSR